VWLAGGGVRPATTIGRTDDYSYNIVDAPVHVHDLQATVLKLLGYDHEQIIYRAQGRDFRLTDIAGDVVDALIR
jgi:arylsulfatase A-like enzyme